MCSAEPIPPATSLSIIPVTGMPEVSPGDDVAALIVAALKAQNTRLLARDVLCVSAKILSKASDLRVPASGAEAHVLRRAHAVIAERVTPRGMTRLVRTHDDTVQVAAGLDGSNVGPEGDYLALPEHLETHAKHLHRSISRLVNAEAWGLILTDTVGRPWREGHSDIALAVAGIPRHEDLRTGLDHDRRPLSVTLRAVADELAAAADLVKGKTTGCPVAVARGWTWPPPTQAQVKPHRTIRTDWFSLGRYEAQRLLLHLTPGTPAAERVGVPMVHGNESLRARLERACRGVRHAVRSDPFTAGQPITVDVEGTSVQVSGESPLHVGYACSLLRVALTAEALAATCTTINPTLVSCSVHEAEPAEEPA